MSRISKRERFFIAAWFECHGSVSVVQRKFREKFGRHAQLPCSATIHRIHQRAAETGDLDDEPRPGRRRSSEDILRVEEDVKEEPQMSIRVRARKLQLSRSNMHRILRDDLILHPYRPRLLQELSEEDFAHRMTFCEEMVELLENDANLLDRFVFTDEAHFHLCGNVNRHNLRYYAKENPNFFLTQPLHSSRVTVWAGVWAGGFLGPFFFDETITGSRYLEMLQNVVLPMLREIEEFNDNRLIWQQDGAPPHWYRPARQWLDQHFGRCWIGRNGPMAWPPRSPDLTASDFWLWGHLKYLVYQTQPVNIDDLKEKIRRAFEVITEEQRLSAIGDFKRRVRLCLQNQGRHIE